MDEASVESGREGPGSFERGRRWGRKRNLNALLNLGVAIQGNAYEHREWAAQHASEIAEVEDGLPEPTSPQALTSMGVSELPGTLNEAASAAFRKEGVHEVPLHRFRVVTDLEGSDWLLKGMSRTYEKAAEYPNRKIVQFEDMRHAQAEVFGSRIASRIGYPVPEARFVVHEGKPWTAVRYIEGAVDWDNGYRRDSLGSVTPISNPEDLEMRTLFNMLVNSQGDNCDQGIVDQTDGKYYANDVNGLGMDRQNREYADMRASMTENYRRGHYTGTDVTGPISPAVVDRFMTEIGDFPLHGVDGIFDDYLGSDAERQELGQRLLERVSVLQELYREGFFDEAPGDYWRKRYVGESGN